MRGTNTYSSNNSNNDDSKSVYGVHPFMAMTTTTTTSKPMMMITSLMMMIPVACATVAVSSGPAKQNAE